MSMQRRFEKMEPLRQRLDWRERKRRTSSPRYYNYHSTVHGWPSCSVEPSVSLLSVRFTHAPWSSVPGHRSRAEREEEREVAHGPMPDGTSPPHQSASPGPDRSCEGQSSIMVPASAQRSARRYLRGKPSRLRGDLETGESRAQRSAGAQTGWRGLLYSILASGRVEERGMVPVPYEERKSTRYFNVFSIWFCMNFNILA